MKTTKGSILYAGTLMGAFLLLLMHPSSAQADPGCFTYTNDLRYCDVVKSKTESVFTTDGVNIIAARPANSASTAMTR
jgi:hypothetical protein